MNSSRATMFSPSRRRICSGACPFFVPEYLAGRKVPGVGICAKHASGASVSVGTPCLWLSKTAGQRATVTPLFAVAEQLAS